MVLYKIKIYSSHIKRKISITKSYIIYYADGSYGRGVEVIRKYGLKTFKKGIK